MEKSKTLDQLVKEHGLEWDVDKHKKTPPWATDVLHQQNNEAKQNKISERSFSEKLSERIALLVAVLILAGICCGPVIEYIAQKLK